MEQEEHTTANGCHGGRHRYLQMEHHASLNRRYFFLLSPRRPCLFLFLLAMCSPQTLENPQTGSIDWAPRTGWGLRFVRGASLVVKDDSGGAGEWLGGLGNTGKPLLPGARAIPVNKQKVILKQKREQRQQGKSATSTPAKVTTPGWKDVYDNVKKKVFTGTLKNTAIWSAVVVAVSAALTYGGYRSLTRFRDARFEQMDQQLRELQARREALARQNPKERFEEAAELEKQHAAALRDIREAVSRSGGSSALLESGVDDDSDVALVALEDIQASQARIEQVRGTNFVAENQGFVFAH